MKIFLAHKVRGTDWDELHRMVSKLVTTLTDAGHTVHNVFLEETNPETKERFSTMSAKDFLEYGFEKLDDSDVLLVYLHSEAVSEGVLLEVGYALAKNKKIILAVQQSIKTTLTDTADKVIQYDAVDDLCETLKEVSFNTL